MLADARRLPFRSEVFQAIVCTEVLEHIREKERVLAECHRVTRSGATLSLSTPLLHVERLLAALSKNYRQSVLATQHRFCVPPEMTLRQVGRYFRTTQVRYAPDEFAYCLAAACLLDITDVRFNDAGELCGANARIVHRASRAFMRATRYLFRGIARVVPYWATKSICLVAVRRDSLVLSP